MFEVKTLILHPCIETRVGGKCLNQSQVTAGSSIRGSKARVVQQHTLKIWLSHSFFACGDLNQ